MFAVDKPIYYGYCVVLYGSQSFTSLLLKYTSNIAVVLQSGFIGDNVLQHLKDSSEVNLY